VVFTAWVVWPLVGPGRWVTGFDTVTYSGPNLAVTLDAVRHGRIAQWNPYVYGGVSHLGNIQAAPLYPPKWPFAWTDVHRAWLLLVALHVVWLGAGMFWLVRRRLGLRPPAGLVATVVVVGSGAVMVRMLFFEQILVLAWAPWLLGALDAATAAPPGRRGRPVAAVAVTSAAVAMSGHPQPAYILVPLAAAWAVGRAVDHGGTGRAALRRLGPVAAGGVLGVLLASPQLLPTLELAARSANTDGRDAATVGDPGFSVQAARLPGTWFGDPFQKVHSVTTAGYENLTFVGVVATVAALVAVVGCRRQPWRATAAVLAAVVAGALLLAAGPRLPFYRLAADWVPGFGQARVPARWSLAAVVATGVLAALGLDRLRTGALPRSALAVLWGACGLAVAVVALGPFELPPATTLVLWVVFGAATAAAAGRPAGARPRTVAVSVAVVAALACTELGLAQRHSAARASVAPEPMTARSAPLVDAVAGREGRVLALTDDVDFTVTTLATRLRPNANVLFRLPSVDGYDGGVQTTDAWASTFAALADGPFRPDAPARSQLRLPLDPDTYAALAVRWLVLDTAQHPADDAAPGWGLPVAVDGALALFENPAWAGTAWLEDPGIPGGVDRAAPLGGVRLARPDPEHLELRFDVSRSGRVVVGEQFDPGWRAEVDGTPVAVVPAGPLYLGFDVGPGEHEVRLRYRSARLVPGLLAASAATVPVLWLLAGSPRPRRRR